MNFSNFDCIVPFPGNVAREELHKNTPPICSAPKCQPKRLPLRETSLTPKTSLKDGGASLNNGELEESLSPGSLSSRDRQALLMGDGQEKWPKAEPVFCRGWRYSPTMVTLQFRVMTRNPSRSSWSMLSGGHRLKVAGDFQSLCSPRRWEIFAGKNVS